MSINASGNKFLKVNLITIFLLFVLILAGGVVRSTGSGMGCPDWPKCFGRYIPPTNISELPANYKKTYADKRLAKNQKFAKLLDVFGYNQLATRIRNDKSILIPEEFNSARTWTEYINRLIGAISGLGLFLCAVFSFKYWKTNKLIVILSIVNLILVGFQAWLGSIVVSLNLVAWVVTVHMLLALAILALSIATYHIAKVQGRYKVQSKPIVAIVNLLVLAISILQITFGTEVREKIDAVAGHLEGSYRDSWVTRAGEIFSQHRDMAILVLISNLVLYVLIRKGFNRHSMQQQVMSFNFLMIMLQIVTGITLSYWSLPPVSQALHILLASLVFGAQFYLLLNLFSSDNVRGAGK
jgi:cytochrome c oxidase assembly protein subunit 15